MPRAMRSSTVGRAGTGGGDDSTKDGIIIIIIYIYYIYRNGKYINYKS
jgi:hypothetical protein